MAGTERRTLEIVAQAVDKLSPVLPKIGTAIGAFGTRAVKVFGGLWKAITSVKTLLVGLGTLLVGRAVLNDAKDVARAAAEYDLWARKLGTTADVLDELAYAAEQSGIEDGFDTVREALKTIQERIDDASKGASTYQEHLNRLGIEGIDPVTGKLKNSVQVLEELAGAFERYAREGRLEELVFATEDLIGGGENLIQVLLQQGPEAIAKLREAAREYGVITERQARLGREVDNAFRAMGRAVETFKRGLLEAFGVDLAAVLRTIAVLIVENKDDILAVLKAVVAVIVQIGVWIVEVARKVNAVINAFIEWTNAIGVFKVAATSVRIEIADLVHELANAEEQLASARRNSDNVDIAESKVADIKSQIAILEAVVAVQDASAATLRTAGTGFENLVVRFGELMKRFRKDTGDAVDRAPEPQPVGDGRQPSQAPDDLFPQRSVQASLTLEKSVKSTVRALDAVGTGISEALARWTDFNAAVADGFGSLVDSTLSGLSDAISDIILNVRSGTEAFRAFGQAALKQLLDIIIQLTIIRSLKGISGLFYADGGVSPKAVVGTLPIRQYASGGVADSPQIAVFGEGPTREAFVPLPDGRNIPVRLQGDTGGTLVFAPQISAVDGKSVRELFLREGRFLGELWMSQIATRGRMRDTARRYR